MTELTPDAEPTPTGSVPAPAGVPAAELAPAAAPTVDWALVQSPAGDSPSPASGKTTGKRGLVTALVIAVVFMVGFGVLSAYLWSVHSQYVAQNEELRSTASSLGTELATSRALADQVQSQLDDTNAQLEVAKATINDLANSEAHAGDDRQALLDIASGLQQCADARQTLIDHLNEASKWTPESLRAYEKTTTAYCNKVIKAYKAVLDE